MSGFFADETTWVGVGLLIFIGILLWAKVPAMLTEGLDKRAKTIANELSEAKRLREEAQSLLVAYKAKQVEAEKEAAALVEAAKAEAERLKTEAKTKLDEFVTRRQKQAEDKIAQAEAQAVADVRNAAADAATKAAATVLGSLAKGAGGAGLIDQGIASVKSKLN
jgi:F-type H+-transporting ATPase subunit b